MILGLEPIPPDPALNPNRRNKTEPNQESNDRWDLAFSPTRLTITNIPLGTTLKVVQDRVKTALPGVASTSRIFENRETKTCFVHLRFKQQVAEEARLKFVESEAYKKLKIGDSKLFVKTFIFRQRPYPTYFNARTKRLVMRLMPGFHFSLFVRHLKRTLEPLRLEGNYRLDEFDLTYNWSRYQFVNFEKEDDVEKVMAKHGYRAILEGTGEPLTFDGVVLWVGKVSEKEGLPIIDPNKVQEGAAELDQNATSLS
jgi:hypothetical protein